MMMGGLNGIGDHETQPRSPCSRAGGSTTAALLHPAAVPTEGKGADVQEGCPASCCPSEPQPGTWHRLSAPAAAGCE